MRLVLLGPPGAGKGTQAAFIAEQYQIPHVSTGDLFRDNVNRGTELGRAAETIMNRGDLVPDEITNAMVADRLAQPDTGNGFLLDGYPRTKVQAEALQTLLDERSTPLDAVVRFVVPRSEVERRITGRSAEEGRSDDSGEAVRRRFEEYCNKTQPLEGYYAERGLIRDVDAVGSIEEVRDRALTVLADVQAPA